MINKLYRYTTTKLIRVTFEDETQLASDSHSSLTAELYDSLIDDCLNEQETVIQTDDCKFEYTPLHIIEFKVEEVEDK